MFLTRSVPARTRSYVTYVTLHVGVAIRYAVCKISVHSPSHTKRLKREAAMTTILRLLWATVLALCLIRVSLYSRACAITACYKHCIYLYRVGHAPPHAHTRRASVCQLLVAFERGGLQLSIFMHTSYVIGLVSLHRTLASRFYGHNVVIHEVVLILDPIAYRRQLCA